MNENTELRILEKKVEELVLRYHRLREELEQLKAERSKLAGQLREIEQRLDRVLQKISDL